MNSKLRKNQKGMVSIIVTMVLIILMTLIVLAMSQNANREQRQALDRQLSDQAFYNAESGINDWANYIYSSGAKGIILPLDKTDCDTPTSFVEAPSSDIGTDGTNKYSCILYDRAPTTIEFDNLSPSDSKVVRISPRSSGLDTLTFSWKAKEGTTNVSDCNLTPASILPTDLGANCNVGGVRIDLVDPGDNTTTTNRTAIQNNNFVAFLLPNTEGGTLAYSTAGNPGNQGSIGQARCLTSTSTCTLTITGIGIPANKAIFLHIKSLYVENDVSVSGTGGVPPVAVRFENAQIMIDATGKANDVLRRVQVRIPALNSYDYPGSFSLRTTQSVCKLITVDSTIGSVTADPRCPIN